MSKVSVIVPLYNKAPYIKKTLDSIAAQTYTDYECIIINDGSTDQSAQVVRDWLEVRGKSEDVRIGTYPRFWMINQPNGGVSAARNRGISESESEFVAFLDADDWWEPTFLEEVVKLADEYPDAGIWASNYWYYKPGKTHVAVKDEDIEDCRLQIADCATAYINYPKLYRKGEMPVWTGAVLLNRLKIEDCRLDNGEYFQTGIKLGEDFLLWSRIATRYKVAFLNKPLAYYNNEIPATLRLTRHLHAPETNMIWHLDWLEHQGEDWKRLVAILRVRMLLDYWLFKEFHQAAAKELAKVEGKLPLDYKLPVLVVVAKQKLMKIGSYCKQRIIRWRIK